jgi:hypothetical protein
MGKIGFEHQLLSRSTLEVLTSLFRWRGFGQIGILLLG